MVDEVLVGLVDIEEIPAVGIVFEVNEEAASHVFLPAGRAISSDPRQ